ncbi:hypothetical protein [Streptomyces sp. NPDC086787]|uniref:hypothetical protein n=1 Tax=Streptomyces sp. NPDC086787 TaxID=3365759 RepID=UPI00381821B4
MAWATGPVAWADFTPGGTGSGSQTQANGDREGDTLSASVVVYDRSKNGSGTSAGAVTSTTTWTPPACYYAPRYTPDQLKAHLEPIWEVGSTGDLWDSQQRDRYVNGKPYKDFNKGKDGDGYFWESFVTDGREADPHAYDCDQPIFWVDKAESPPASAPQSVTPEVLAGLAYNEIRVPSTKVTLAPADETKVNLPTWAWLDGAEFKPVAVTASVPVLGISSTVTAEPVSLKIDPGTADAVTYPASGVCGISGGTIGEAFARGKADQAPPCGVRYLRSSGTGSYQLRATVTWRIHWTGSNGAGGDLPDGAFGATQEVDVQEIQAVNR